MCNIWSLLLFLIFYYCNFLLVSLWTRFQSLQNFELYSDVCERCFINKVWLCVIDPEEKLHHVAADPVNNHNWLTN